MHTIGFSKQLLRRIKNGEEMRSNASRFCPCSGGRSSSYRQRSGLRVEDPSLGLNERCGSYGAHADLVTSQKVLSHDRNLLGYPSASVVVAGLELAKYDRRISSIQTRRYTQTFMGRHAPIFCALGDVGANVILEAGNLWRVVQEVEQHSRHCALHKFKWTDKTRETADNDDAYIHESTITRVSPFVRSSGNSKPCSDSETGLSRKIEAVEFLPRACTCAFPQARYQREWRCRL